MFVTVVSYDALIETLTFLFTDIEGSTALLRLVGDDVYARILEHHHELVRASLDSHGGIEQGTQGDSFFAVFTSPSACVSAALELQRALATGEWPDGRQPRVRMGIHTGEVTGATTGLVGYEVHRAARIAAVGHGGQILLSSAAAGLVEDSLPEDVTLRDLGPHRLKDLGRPETIFQLVIEGLNANFPPLRSLDNPELANNLPASLNPFVGRTVELAEVRSLVLESRLVTLTGSGGSGKTRLALQVAAELLDGNAEGVWFVDLAPISDAEQIPAVIIAALQLRHEPDYLPLDWLLQTLREQRLLIIMDNCEHLIDAVAKLADQIGRGCTRVSIVATSREPLGVDGERVYRVRSLSLPSEVVESVDDLAGSDAVELFVARTRAHDSTFALDDAVAPRVASICRRLDGIPLAIELAASRLSTMSLDDLHDRLDQRFRLLTGGSRNALPRQQTLGAMVAWSYDLLTESEREVLRRLSVFVGGFDLQAAEAVCAAGGIGSLDVADMLSSLVYKSLVGAERSSTTLRYRLLETIRQYAADQLIQVGGEAGASAVRQRHAEYYLRLCEDGAKELSGPNQGVWMKRLDLEWDNLQSALYHFSSSAFEPEKVMRIGTAIAPFLITRQHTLPYDLLVAALDSGEVSLALRARALLVVAMIRAQYDPVNSFEFVEERANEAMALSREQGDRQLEIEALTVLSGNSRNLGHLDLGRSQAQQSADLARELGDDRITGRALLALSMYQPSLGKGQELQLEALTKLREAGDLLWVCNTLVILSLSGGLFEGDLDVARSLTEEALEYAERIGSTWHTQLLWTNYGVMLVLLDELEQAEQFSRRALLELRRNGMNPSLLYWIIFALACCATRNGDAVRGAQLIGAHGVIEKRLPESSRGFWSPVEIEMRERNRSQLLEVLGGVEFEHWRATGSELSMDELTDLALRRGKFRN